MATWIHPYAIGVAAAVVLTAGCRTERIWSGIEVGLDGRVKLVAEEPLCGCFTVANATDSSVRLQAARGGQLLGQATLRTRERRSFRFDWAGAYRNSSYTVEVSTPEGRRLDARQALRIDAHPSWVFCEEAACEYGSLAMNLMDLGH